jgi:hypothetical protein
MTLQRSAVVALYAAAVLCAWPAIARAQLKGHYIPGFTGLQNGSLPPPGISLSLPVYVYPTHTIKDNDGDELRAQPEITSSFVGLGLAWVTHAQVFGGNLGGQIMPISYMKSRVESGSLDVPGSFAFTDMFFQPLWLGWSHTRVDYSAGWSFFTPNGKWEPGGSDNAGLGMWSNDFQAGATVRLDDRQAWTTSALATYEIHSHKRDTDFRVGDIFTVEGGTGRSFDKKVEGSPDPQVVNVGLAYYAQFKVTSDRVGGPNGSVPSPGHKDRVYGAGPEASILLPKSGLFVDLRVVPEFGARNRTQGVTWVLSLGYDLKPL